MKKFLTINIIVIVSIFLSSCVFSSSSDSSNQGFVDEVVFSGRIVQGEGYEYKVNDDMIFKLDQDDWGWTMSLVDSKTKEKDYSIVTLPLRGMSPKQIFGWHLRNIDNTSLNDGSVNAPGQIREFEFVTNDEDYEKVSEAIGKLNWSYKFEEEEVEEAGKVFWEVNKSKGIFKITDMEFDNLDQGAQTGFDWIEFEVELYF